MLSIKWLMKSAEGAKIKLVKLKEHMPKTFKNGG